MGRRFGVCLALLVCRCGTEPMGFQVASPNDAGFQPPPPFQPPTDASTASDASVADAGSSDAGIQPRRSSIGRFVRTEIVVDTDSFAPTDADLAEFARIANDLLVERTDVEIRLDAIRRISFRAVASSLPVADRTIVGPAQVLGRVYEQLTPPEFFIFLRADNMSASFGAYSLSFEKSGTCNRFRQPVTGKRTRAWGGVVDFAHMYASCGYDHSDPIHPVHMRDVSADGECKNRSGVRCVLRPSIGYYQCENISPALYYNSSRFTFAAAASVHELMHNFGQNGNMDHFGTTTCDALMGGNAYQNNDDDETFQRYAGMCPVTFDAFKQSFAECI